METSKSAETGGKGFRISCDLQECAGMIRERRGVFYVTRTTDYTNPTPSWMIYLITMGPLFSWFSCVVWPFYIMTSTLLNFTFRNASWDRWGVLWCSGREPSHCPTTWWLCKPPVRLCWKEPMWNCEYPLGITWRDTKNSTVYISVTTCKSESCFNLVFLVNGVMSIPALRFWIFPDLVQNLFKSQMCYIQGWYIWAKVLRVRARL